MRAGRFSPLMAFGVQQVRISVESAGTQGLSMSYGHSMGAATDSKGAEEMLAAPLYSQI